VSGCLLNRLPNGGLELLLAGKIIVGLSRLKLLTGLNGVVVLLIGD
jgi:hypothetical protein